MRKERYMKQNMHSESSVGMSWPVIGIVFVCFFPIAIVMMLMKLHKEKENYISNGKIIKIIGWIFCAIGIIYLIAGVTGGLEASEGESVISGVIMMLAVCCGGGYALAMHGQKYQKLGLDYQKYVPLLERSIDGSLDKIAAACGETYEATSSSIKKLVDAGMISEGYVDCVGRCFVTDQVKKEVKIRTVECSHCGGVSKVLAGQEPICEYCGMPIE